MNDNPFDIHAIKYENWFKDNNITFQSEVLALKRVLPIKKEGIEIGIGSGIFAEKLNIKRGIDSSQNMLKLAQQRNLNVDYGFAENLPYSENSFDFAAFITSLCFIDNPIKALQEAHRVIKKNGNIIIAFLDKYSTIGKMISSRKDESKFYKKANFYSVGEVITLIKSCNFMVSEIFQTLINSDNLEVEEPIRGFGKGSFVVIKGIKK